MLPAPPPLPPVPQQLPAIPLPPFLVSFLPHPQQLPLVLPHLQYLQVIRKFLRRRVLLWGFLWKLLVSSDERMHHRQLQASCLNARQRVTSENKGFAERWLAGWLTPPASQQPFNVLHSLQCKLPFQHGCGYIFKGWWQCWTCSGALQHNKLLLKLTKVRHEDPIQS